MFQILLIMLGVIAFQAGSAFADNDYRQEAIALIRQTFSEPGLNAFQPGGETLLNIAESAPKINEAGITVLRAIASDHQWWLKGGLLNKSENIVRTHIGVYSKAFEYVNQVGDQHRAWMLSELINEGVQFRRSSGSERAEHIDLVIRCMKTATNVYQVKALRPLVFDRYVEHSPLGRTLLTNLASINSQADVVKLLYPNDPRKLVESISHGDNAAVKRAEVVQKALVYLLDHPDVFRDQSKLYNDKIKKLVATIMSTLDLTHEHQYLAIEYLADSFKSKYGRIESFAIREPNRVISKRYANNQTATGIPDEAVARFLTTAASIQSAEQLQLLTRMGLQWDHKTDAMIFDLGWIERAVSATPAEAAALIAEYGHTVEPANGVSGFRSACRDFADSLRFMFTMKTKLDR